MIRLNILLLSFLLFFVNDLCLSQDDSIQVIIKTFRGNEKRNFYGHEAPKRLNEKWKLNLGRGRSVVKDIPRVWTGAGWTGQPLLVIENEIPYIIQGAYDYNLRKINANTGKVVWKYKFDDIIKGTGTIWENQNSNKPENRFVIMQGSRYGAKNDWYQKVIPSFRAISYLTGKELWRMNVKQTYSYSRDVDGSPLVINDTAYIGLENGIFTIFNPDSAYTKMKDGIVQPQIFKEFKLYNDSDVLLHGVNFVTEASPTLVKNKVVIGACSRIIAYNLETKKPDWNFYIATDIDGSAVATKDDKILVTLERQYIEGKAGVMKLDPFKPEEQSVEWFFPTENRKYSEWEGGIVGSLAVNDYYNKNDSLPGIAAFSGIDGYLYVVDYNTIDTSKTVLSPDKKNSYPTPKQLFKYKIGPGISSPIIVDDKIIACSAFGIYLFKYTWEANKFKAVLLSKRTGISFEASPIVWNKKVYVASRNGYLYCFGD